MSTPQNLIFFEILENFDKNTYFQLVFSNSDLYQKNYGFDSLVKWRHDFRDTRYNRLFGFCQPFQGLVRIDFSKKLKLKTEGYELTN